MNTIFVSDEHRASQAQAEAAIDGQEIAWQERAAGRGPAFDALAQREAQERRRHDAQLDAPRHGETTEQAVERFVKSRMVWIIRDLGERRLDGTAKAAAAEAAALAQLDAATNAVNTAKAALAEQEKINESRERPVVAARERVEQARTALQQAEQARAGAVRLLDYQATERAQKVVETAAGKLRAAEDVLRAIEDSPDAQRLDTGELEADLHRARQQVVAAELNVSTAKAQLALGQVVREYLKLIEDGGALHQQEAKLIEACAAGVVPSDCDVTLRQRLLRTLAGL